MNSCLNCFVFVPFVSPFTSCWLWHCGTTRKGTVFWGPGWQLFPWGPSSRGNKRWPTASKLKILTLYTWGYSSLVNCKTFCEGPGFDSQEYQLVTPVVPYLSTEFAGCSINSGISCGARKLTQTSRVIKKKKSYTTI